ncbi:MAG: tryptophanase [Bdellovibrionales bacterium]|nr:tryptophanase [Bdellovibrionales bacterium]
MTQYTGTLFEPFKIKAVEALPMATAEERKGWIEKAFFNVFSLASEQVTIDLLTDSGTGAMSDIQWGEMLQADESYAGSRSFKKLETIATELTGMEFAIPVHQGRAAEHILFSELVTPGSLVLSNGFFDTTLANAQSLGAETRNLTIKEAKDPFLPHPFKGNIDLQALEDTLQAEGDRIPFVLLTITNNSGGGQPVSLENLTQAAELTHRYGKLFVLDACRFAENAYFIKSREPGMDQESAKSIAQKCFNLADAVTFSGKKDALANIGGLLCVRTQELADKAKNHMIVVEGFPTYGGLAGYSLAAMAQGLTEVLDETYLKYRLRTIEWMVEQLEEAQVPVIRPAGGHAVYLESSQFFPHIEREKFPGIALTTELYIQGGIRACELGTVAFGYRNEQGKHILPPLDLVRLAIPRRVYTEAHMGFVVNQIVSIFQQRDTIRGYEFLEEFPVMRHFRSKFRRCSGKI